jgi:hypothetical protein
MKKISHGFVNGTQKDTYVTKVYEICRKVNIIHRFGSENHVQSLVHPHSEFEPDGTDIFSGESKHGSKQGNGENMPACIYHTGTRQSQLAVLPHRENYEDSLL